MLSGGASFGKFHLGLISALYEQDLLPRIICGASAGSLLGAILCSVPYNDVYKVWNYEAMFTREPLVHFTIEGTWN
jgi:predicted acylesterase/phospholipase RssA